MKNPNTHTVNHRQINASLLLMYEKEPMAIAPDSAALVSDTEKVNIQIRSSLCLGTEWPDIKLMH